jgi:predicted  nucleic acid-binding Zn-ribbon protein
MAQKLTLKDLALTAQKRGGYCLATHYKNSGSKVEWQCSEGHVFDASARQVRSGSWCPRCSQSFFFREEICRLSFETIFNQPFPKCRPDWLLNERGNRMELDGYNEQLKLAFEYNGEQHYNTNFFSQNQTLESRQKDDELKAHICNQKDVLLIIFTPDDDLTQISKQIETTSKHKPTILKNADLGREIDFDGVWQHRNKIAALRQLARSKNGKLISTKYLGQKTHLTWECEQGHRWTAGSGNILTGHWCPDCGGRPNLNIYDMQNFVEKFGGVCLSKEYINTRSSLNWQCINGHKWEASYAHIRLGYWCIKCAQDPHILEVENPYVTVRIEQLKSIARAKGGECLSDIYLGDDQKLIWRCANGHTWDAVPGSIKQGRWCPDCGGRPRLNLQIAQQAALDFEGECLSTEYINVKTKMKWRCKKGHEWETSFDSVRQGNWCRRCSQITRRMREKIQTPNVN